MYFFQKRSTKYGIIIFLSLVIFTTVSCIFKKNDTKIELTDIKNEDRDIASFLVKSTEINRSITNLAMLAQSNSKSILIKDVLNKQVKICSELQNQIKIIAENRFVTIPVIVKPTIIRYKSDDVIVKMLLKDLQTQIMNFEKITLSTRDGKIFNLKTEFLPKLYQQTNIINNLNNKLLTN